MSFTLNAAQLDAIKKEVQENYYKRAVVAQTIVNASSMVAPGSKSITFPTVSSAAMQDKTAGVALSDAGFTLDGDVMNLDKNKAIYTTIEDRSELQTVPNLGATVVREFAKAWVDQLESDVIAEIKNVSTAAPDHLIPLDDGVGTEITQSQILEARKLLNDQKLPMSERFIALSTKQEKAMLSIADFVRADSYGNASGLVNGTIGRIYGMDVVIANGLGDDEAVVYHKDHMAWASQQTPKFERDRDIKNLSDEFSLSLLYGVKALRGGIYGVSLNVTGS